MDVINYRMKMFAHRKIKKGSKWIVNEDFAYNKTVIDVI